MECSARSAVRMSVSAVVMNSMDFCCISWPLTVPNLVLSLCDRELGRGLAAQEDHDRKVAEITGDLAAPLKVPCPALFVVKGETLVDQGRQVPAHTLLKQTLAIPAGIRSKGRGSMITCLRPSLM